jgi:glutathione S-transferase
MLRLYCAPRTISIAVSTALYQSGIHWEQIRVDIAGGEQTRPDYHAINPKGRVPVLMTPEGPLTETGAILEYLAETSMPGFVPADPLARARMREVMFYLASTMHVNHAHKLRGKRWASEQTSIEDMKAKVPETMAASCAYIERLIVGPYLFGSDLTLADFYLFAVCTWLEGDGVDVTQFPKLSAFIQAMEATPGVRQAYAAGLVG